MAKRAFSEFKDDNITDWAAALTYYAVLSIFPGVIVFVSLLGLLGQGPRHRAEAARTSSPTSGSRGRAGQPARSIEDVVNQQSGKAGLA